MTAEFNDLVKERIRRANEVIEQACEAALAGGQYGVRVVHTATTTTAQVDPQVPYGYIYESWDNSRYEMPSQAHRA